jgi:hypothetical protein
MTAILVLLAVWAVASTAVAFLFGRAIRLADERAPGAHRPRLDRLADGTRLDYPTADRPEGDD